MKPSQADESWGRLKKARGSFIQANTPRWRLPIQQLAKPSQSLWIHESMSLIGVHDSVSCKMLMCVFPTLFCLSSSPFRPSPLHFSYSNKAPLFAPFFSSLFSWPFWNIEPISQTQPFKWFYQQMKSVFSLLHLKLTQLQNMIHPIVHW